MNYYFGVFQKFTDFKGRARRKEFWMFYLFNIIAIILLGSLTAIVSELSFIVVLYYLFMIIPYFAVAVRRMHDTGNSGWFILIPIYNLVLLCTNGEDGSNEYGPDPKSDGDEINEIGAVTKY